MVSYLVSRFLLEGRHTRKYSLFLFSCLCRSFTPLLSATSSSVLVLYARYSFLLHTTNSRLIDRILSSSVQTCIWTQSLRLYPVNPDASGRLLFSHVFRVPLLLVSLSVSFETLYVFPAAALSFDLPKCLLFRHLKYLHSRQLNCTLPRAASPALLQSRRAFHLYIAYQLCNLFVSIANKVLYNFISFADYSYQKPVSSSLHCSLIIYYFIYWKMMLKKSFYTRRYLSWVIDLTPQYRPVGYSVQKCTFLQ